MSQTKIITCPVIARNKQEVVAVLQANNIDFTETDRVLCFSRPLPTSNLELNNMHPIYWKNVLGSVFCATPLLMSVTFFMYINPDSDYFNAERGVNYDAFIDNMYDVHTRQFREGWGLFVSENPVAPYRIRKLLLRFDRDEEQWQELEEVFEAFGYTIHRLEREREVEIPCSGILQMKFFI